MKNILLVEDDVDLTNLYNEILSNAGYSVITADEKEKAKEILLNEDISFVLLDVMLVARTSGLDLLEEIRSSKKGRKIPIVVLTNVAKKKEKKRALKLGAKEYLLKASQNPEDIISVVKRYTST